MALIFHSVRSCTRKHPSAHSHPLSTLSTAHQSTALQGRLAYRRAIVQRLIPALRAFSPGLILISAGFDGAQGKVLPCLLHIYSTTIFF